MSEESTAVITSIERNVHSMEEEIDGSWQRASENWSQANMISSKLLNTLWWQLS